VGGEPALSGPPGPAGWQATIPRTLTAEQRERVLKDPLVRQALELFDGAVVNIERQAAAALSRPAEATE